MTVARLFAVAVIAASSLASLAGCSGRTAGLDLTSPDPDPTDPGPGPDPGPDPVDPPCATIAPACDRGDKQYSSDQSCKNAGSDHCYTRSSTCNGKIVSTIVCGGGSECDGIPVCDEGDTQTTGCPKSANATCYSRTTCGTTIMCVHYEPTCGAVPTCDPGDAQVPAGSSVCSVPGYTCYSRTMCGSTILCAKKT